MIIKRTHTPVNNEKQIMSGNGNVPTEEEFAKASGMPLEHQTLDSVFKGKITLIMYAFSKNTLRFGENNKISFSFDIAKAIFYDELTVVMLKTPDGVKFNENIFGVRTDGKIKWQVEKVLPDSDDSPYVDILKLSDGLFAINWAGVKAKINLDTGKVIHKRISK